MSWLELSLELGGRFLLTLLAIDVMLLLILEIMKHGDFKNRRYRSKVSSSYRLWKDSAFKRSQEFNGVEVLETYPESISTRQDMFGARFTVTEEDIFRPDENGTRRADGITIHTLSGATESVRLDKGELSTPAVDKEPLSHSLTKEQIA